MESTKASTNKRELWKQLSGKQKLQYIWDYYKFPIAVCLILLYIAGYIIYGHFSQKNTILYTALVNISASEDLSAQISDGFMNFADIDSSKNNVQLYTGLYLTSDQNNPNYEYTYASRMKIIASTDGEQLDVVFMNQEAFDAFTQNGYLCNLEELLHNSDPEILAELKPYLITNDEYPMGLDVSQKGVFQQAGFEEPVYLGVLINSPRADTAIRYIEYLYSSP